MNDDELRMVFPEVPHSSVPWCGQKEWCGCSGGDRGSTRSVIDSIVSPK